MDHKRLILPLSIWMSYRFRNAKAFLVYYSFIPFLNLKIEDSGVHKLFFLWKRGEVGSILLLMYLGPNYGIHFWMVQKESIPSGTEGAIYM